MLHSGAQEMKGRERGGGGVGREGGKEGGTYRVESTKMVVKPVLTAMRSRYASMASPRPPLR